MSIFSDVLITKKTGNVDFLWIILFGNGNSFRFKFLIFHVNIFVVLGLFVFQMWFSNFMHTVM